MLFYVDLLKRTVVVPLLTSAALGCFTDVEVQISGIFPWMELQGLTCSAAGAGDTCFFQAVSDSLTADGTSSDPSTGLLLFLF